MLRKVKRIKLGIRAYRRIVRRVLERDDWRCLRIPGQGGRDSEIDLVGIPKLVRSRFRDEVGQGFRF